MGATSVFLRSYYRLARDPNTDVRLGRCLAKSAYCHLRGALIFAHHNTTIRGIRNIETKAGRLFLGVYQVGFLSHFDKSYMHVRGKLVVEGDVSLGKGCRVDVGPGATCILRGCTVTGATNVIVARRTEIGEGTVISWGCEFLDENWHTIAYEGRREREGGIVVGRRVWIGSHVKVLKGARIADGSVVAAGSVITKAFDEQNVLLAGNPAAIVRRGVSWQ